MLKPIRSISAALIALPTIGCGAMSQGFTDMAAITKAINATSQCRVSRSEFKTRNGNETALVEMNSCDVRDAVSEADRLNEKLLATVPEYKKLDGFTFIFTNGGVRQSVEYTSGERVTE